MMVGQIIVGITKPLISRLAHGYAEAARHKAELREYAAALHAAEQVERQYLANRVAPEQEKIIPCEEHGRPKGNEATLDCPEVSDGGLQIRRQG